ncbi:MULTISPECIES: proton-conducting transporter membrane subunit [unclassified Lebetimonas]|uniref:proton-conducting transporter transmembrane domain-containing protein n=1 Tax=unclassified Lebetimonas TaxID=2648158 RepID=UPI0004630B32|nr:MULTISPECIES: proton-conducting transporter membrane subunit [unclassified Lebetimonas]
MGVVYSLYIIAAVTSLVLYKENKIALKVGFGLTALASAYAVFYFLIHLTSTESLSLGNYFIFNPHFMLDPLRNFFSLVISFIGLAASIYSMNYAEEYSKAGSLGVMAFFYSAFILAMLLVISAANVFWFMIFWELMTWVSYFLICFNDSQKSLKATIIYMGIAHFGGVMILISLLLLSYQAGSLEFSHFYNLSLSPVMAAIIFLFAFFGFGSKAGMFPLHVWLPMAHPAAPSNVSALMSGVMIKVAIFGMIQTCLWLPLTSWMGITILIIGALSALLGVLYALMQHDYKALLAYHSVENIGIILLGLGTGVYGMAIHSPVLAAVGFLAGLYHVLNHATFKGLLFLGAGSVLYTTHTKDMEVLGGLAKKMPLTAFAFLIGSMAISALPPLNGFVSEWLTYQSMLQAALGDGILYRFAFTLSIVALALTGALAVFCFVKVYSVIFGGVPRNRKIYEKAKEVPLSMLTGMYLLVIACFAFGLGATKIVNYLMNVVSSFAGNYQATAGGNLVSPLGSMVSTPFIAIMLISFLALPFIFVVIYINNSKTKVTIRETDPWACGFKYSPRMQMTAAPFTGSLRRLMDWLYRSDTKVEDQGYFKPVKFIYHARDIWWNLFYSPFIKITAYLSEKMKYLQNGNTNIYILYILLTLFIFVGIAYLL